MQIEEIWKSIKGYEDLYAVSNFGKVKSLKYGKILKPQNKGNGYLQVSLCRNGKRKTLLVHRLVAEAFIPNPYGLPEINHIDENKSNNCVENLEWSDAKYNTNYGSRTKRISAALTNHPVFSKSVEASKFPDFREIELRFVSTAEAGRNGYCNQCVSRCCRGCFNREGNNKYRGLYWRYAV